MTGPRAKSLDPRVWLVWGLAASVPALTGRNPFALAAVTIAVIGVRFAWQPAAAGLSSWRWVIRLALIFAAIGIVFNVLTYHGGDTELVRIPGDVPLIGGPLTLNALAYGILSGWSLLILVLVGTTIGALIDWPALLRMTPRRLTTFAVAGSVAFAFLPQTANAYRDIREAQAIRGHRLAGPRDFPPIVAPLLTGGLERAITMAEALESRGFGATLPQSSRRQGRFGLITMTVAALLAAVLLFDGRVLLAVAALAFGMAGIAIPVSRRDDAGTGRTSFRRACWRRADTVVAFGAGVAIIATFVTLALAPHGLRYVPYPSLSLPEINVPLLAALCLVLGPAFAAPVPAIVENAP
ncbi:MAG TPA: energy-coupling factor transporter transmembrane component T [Thermomicrobiales bacterium]|nr:energy-coupling factor transporter transmembrane component T [Thermomicrobiales bacterium]